MNVPPSCLRFSSGMTLAELLLVLLLISVLVGMSTSMMRDSIESQQLNTTATALTHQLSNCALQAVRLNRAVEIRFLQNDPARPGQWCSMQAWARDPASGTNQPLGHLFRLGEHITFLDSPEHSGILGLKTSSGHIGGFSFHPRGSTSLPRIFAKDSNPNCLTLIPSRFLPVRDGSLPSLSRTLSIHPTSGKITLY
jgi:uncharacterized protein (TIGR02596 family)